MTFDPFKEGKEKFNRIFYKLSDYLLLITCFILLGEIVFGIVNNEMIFLGSMGIVLLFIVAKLFRIQSMLEAKK